MKGNRNLALPLAAAIQSNIEATRAHIAALPAASPASPKLSACLTCANPTCKK